MLLLQRLLNFGTVVAIAAATAGAFAQSPGPGGSDTTLTRQLFDILPWKTETQSAAQEALAAAKVAQEAAVAAKAASNAAAAALKAAQAEAADATQKAAAAKAAIAVDPAPATLAAPPTETPTSVAAAAVTAVLPLASVDAPAPANVPAPIAPTAANPIPVAAVEAVKLEPGKLEPAKTEPVAVAAADPTATTAPASAPAAAPTPGTPGTDAKADDPPAADDKDAAVKPKVPQIPAKTFFGAAKTPAPLEPRVYGGYAAGCLAGGVELQKETDKWQAMRLSRNRNWGHPKLIELLDRFATDMKTKEKWPGLLIGDLAQPRGGPMKSGHKSHQVGLDADIWFKPMPSKVLSHAERETYEPLLLAEDNGDTVITKNWNEGFVRLIRRAASYPEVERIFVHPAIKQEFCKVSDTDRRWLKKVRPMWLHNYHFHVRMGCPAGSPGCVAQPPPPKEDDGCGKEIEDWIKMVSRPPPVRSVDPKPDPKPSRPPPVLTLEKLPAQCRDVITAGNPPEIKLPERVAKTVKPGVAVKPDVAAKPAGAANVAKPAAKPEKSSSFAKPPKAKPVKFARAYYLGASPRKYQRYVPQRYVAKKVAYKKYARR